MSDVRIITANSAAALAAKLCRVQVVSAYPITPQTPVTEELAELVESGELKAEYLTVESEHSAMASVVAASQVGARVFTASSANGLLYMHEMLHWAAGSRTPVVMACVNRGVGAPWTILNDQQDSISQRDTGWIQLYCKNSQEVIDSIIQAYKIAEQVNIPVMVCYDGFILSHTTTPVEIPSQQLVDSYLPPRPPVIGISEYTHMNVNPLILSDPRPDVDGKMAPGYMDIRYRLQQDLLSCLDVIKLADRDFHELFGRTCGGVCWGYKMTDAAHAIVSFGSLASECTLAADLLRQRGLRFGVLGVRSYRPFPKDDLVKALEAVETVTIFEKDVSYGYEGALAMDLKSALYESANHPRFSSYVAGLGGRDVLPETLADEAYRAITGEVKHAWINIKN
jgi:pyruvate/2-oxoacid:ferredoxin oxidoreductase alpha subunit